MRLSERVFLKMLCIISTHIRFLTYCKLIFFSKMIKSRVHSFRKAHLLMPQYFHLSVRNLIKKGAFWALKAISAHEIASNKEKAPFLFEDCMISWQMLEFLMIFWKSSMFWNDSWCFQKAPFPSNCA